MVIARNFTKKSQVGSLSKLEPMKYTPITRMKYEVPKVPRRSMAYLSQIKRTSTKTNTRLGIEQDFTKNPFGTKNAKPGDQKNHLCLTDVTRKLSKSLTSSTGQKGIVKQYHHLAAPGQIIKPKGQEFKFTSIFL